MSIKEMEYGFFYKSRKVFTQKKYTTIHTHKIVTKIQNKKRIYFGMKPDNK